jgi:hypothetical protein
MLITGGWQAAMASEKKITPVASIPATPDRAASPIRPLLFAAETKKPRWRRLHRGFSSASVIHRCEVGRPTLRKERHGSNDL